MRDSKNLERERKSVAELVSDTGTCAPSPCNPSLRTRKICHLHCAALIALSLLLTSSLVSGQSTKPTHSDGVQYVTMSGTDSNDGLSWGTAKASINAALAALPSCVSGASNYSHCGEIAVAAGTYTISSQMQVNSPFVAIRGIGSNVTNLDFTATSGCAFLFDALNNSNSGGNASGGLFDLKITGNNTANVCGVHTQGTVGFRMHGVSIYGFTGPGASGWWDDEVFNGTSRQASNERYKVSVELANNTVGWKLTDNGTLAPNDTFGYGDFALWVNTYVNQTAISADGGVFTFSNLHVILNSNSSTGTTGIQLANGAKWFSNLYNIHFEGEAKAFNLASGTSLDGVGVIHVTLTSLGTVPLGTTNLLGKIYESNNLQGFMMAGDVAGCAGLSNMLVFNICSPSTSLVPLNVGIAGTNYFRVNTDGTLRVSTNNSSYLISAGTLTLSGGTASHTFSRAYRIAPVCTVTDTTRPEVVRVNSSTTAVRFTGTGSDVITWICTPAAN